MAKQKPIHEVTYWPVRVSIWRNESDDGSRVNYSTVVNRVYSTGEGKKKEWHSTPSLDVEDILPAAKALEEAFAWIHQAMAQDRQQAQAA